MTTQPTIHYPRPAIVPTDAESSWKRRFGDASRAGGTWIDASTDRAMAPMVRVMRSAADDAARLELEIGIWTDAKITVRLTPAELRELAARLIDAAYDIEAFPAAVLTKDAA